MKARRLYWCSAKKILKGSTSDKKKNQKLCKLSCRFVFPFAIFLGICVSTHLSCFFSLIFRIWKHILIILVIQVIQILIWCCHHDENICIFCITSGMKLGNCFACRMLEEYKGFWIVWLSNFLLVLGDNWETGWRAARS